MSERQTAILGFATLIAVLAAIWVLLSENSVEQAAPERLYPDLADSVNAIEQVILTGPENRTELAKRDGTWVLANRNGYPADDDRVRRFLLALTQVDRVDRKTARDDRMDRIGLGSGALRVSLGEAAPELAIGDEAPGAGGLRFVRRADEEAAWTATGLPTISATPGDWMVPDLFDIARPRIHSIAVTPPDGGGYTLTRLDPQGPFRLADQTEAERLKEFGGADAIVTGLSFMDADDVRPFRDLDATPWALTLTSFDGLKLLMDLYPGPDGPWVTLSAVYDPSILEQEAMPTEMPDAEADVAAEAARLNQAWAGWQFKLPAFKGEDLTQRRAALVEASEDQE